MPASQKLEKVILNYSSEFSNIFSFSLRDKKIFKLDLGPENQDLKDRDMTDNAVFTDYLEAKLKESGNELAVGGYNEERLLYSKSSHFGSGAEIRNIHMGLDIWIEAGTAIHTFHEATIHSFNINTNYRDYGPTMILKHSLADNVFYTLYGHLSLDSLSGISKGMKLRAGERFASVGSTEVNGTWPPHLHLQIIKDMGNYSGDYPGVTSKKEREVYLSLCPDPKLILGLDL